MEVDLDFNIPYTAAAMTKLPCSGGQFIFAYTKSDQHFDICALRLNANNNPYLSRCDLALCPVAETTEDVYRNGLRQAIIILDQHPNLIRTESLDVMNSVITRARSRLSVTYQPT